MGVPTRLLASQKPLFEGDCEFIVLRGADGDLGVLPGHAPLLTWLKPGEVMLRHSEREEYFFLADGFLEVLPNRVSILAQSGESSAALNPQEEEGIVKAVEAAVARAVSSGEQEMLQLQAELTVAMARLEAAERQRRRGRE